MNQACLELEALAWHLIFSKACPRTQMKFIQIDEKGETPLSELHPNFETLL